MTHLSMEALLRLREPGREPGDATARTHLESCPECRAEHDRLHQRVARLRALPALRPTRDRWPEVAARVRLERRARRQRLGGLLGLGPHHCGEQGAHAAPAQQIPGYRRAAG